MSKTIAGAIVDIAIEQGASESSSAKTITEALNLLDTTLAGAAQTRAATIADGIAAVGEHIPEESGNA